MRAGFAWSFLMLVVLAPLAAGGPGKVVLDAPPLPYYCVYLRDPFIEPRGSDGSCGSQVMRYVVDEMNRVWCQHVAACPGGRGPFDYRDPGILP